MELAEEDAEPTELTEVLLGSWMTTSPYLPRELMMGKVWKVVLLWDLGRERLGCGLAVVVQVEA